MRSSRIMPGKAVLFFLGILFLVVLSGCTNSGGVENGAISGTLKLMGDDGMPSDQELPGITIRVDGTEDASSNFSRTTIVESSTGEYTIPDLPVGNYQLRIIAPPYSDAFAYTLQIWDGFPASTNGTIPTTAGGTQSDAGNDKKIAPVYVPSAEEAVSPSYKITSTTQSNATALGQVISTASAIVGSGETYIMPSLYLVKSDTIPDDGMIKGQVLNVVAQTYVADATIMVTDSSGKQHTTVTKDDGSFSIANVFPGTGSILVEKSGLIFSPNGDTTLGGQSQSITVPEGRILDLELYMTPGDATLSGIISSETALEQSDWDRVHITVQGVSLADDDIEYNAPRFNLKVPTGLPSYTVEIFGDIIATDTADTVMGPLKVGATYPVVGLEIDLKRADIRVKVFAASPAGLPPNAGSIISIRTDKGQLVDCIFDGGSLTSGESILKDVPHGQRTFTTSGGSALRKDIQTQSDGSYTTTYFTEASEQIEIYGDTSLTIVLK